MTKLPLRTPDKTQENFAALASLFPNAVTETVDENGAVVRAIDADVLRQEINVHAVEGIYPVSVDSERIERGIGNSTAVMREDWIPCRYGYKAANTNDRRNSENAPCPHKNSVHCPLATVHSLDSTNMKDVYYTPQETTQADLFGLIDNIKPDRTLANFEQIFATYSPTTIRRVL
jgi:hypothetical protein